MDANSKELNGDRLVRLLEQQQELYRKLRVLADRQKTLVMQDDPEPLLALLADRQRLVDGLVGLNADLAPFRKNWSEIYAALDEDCRKRVSTLLEEVNASLGKILQSDQNDTATLTARRESMANRMATVSAGGQANAAYARSSVRGQLNMTDSKA